MKLHPSKWPWDLLFPNNRLMQIFLLMIDALSIYNNQVFTYRSDDSFFKLKCHFYWQLNRQKVWFSFILTSMKENLSLGCEPPFMCSASTFRTYIWILTKDDIQTLLGEKKRCWLSIPWLKVSSLQWMGNVEIIRVAGSPISLHTVGDWIFEVYPSTQSLNWHD